MWRSISSIVMVALLAACASAANAPTVDPTATTTTPAKDSSRSGCPMSDDVPAPSAVLSYGDQQQADARVALNWRSEDCSVNFHPSFTTFLPGNGLEVPLGASPELTFSVMPDTISGYAWRPDFSLAEASFGEKI